MLFKKKEEKKEEILPNEYDLKLKELNNAILTYEVQLRRIIKRLVEIEKFKHSFIIYTDFNNKADEDYNNLLNTFESIVKNLTFAIKSYNKYLADNISHFVTTKDYFSKPDDEKAMYNKIKNCYLLIEKRFYFNDKFWIVLLYNELSFENECTIEVIE